MNESGSKKILIEEEAGKRGGGGWRVLGKARRIAGWKRLERGKTGNDI